jgi:hypothetical protein
MNTAVTDNREPADPATPFPGWEREVPRYRATREVRPGEKARFRFEPPFALASDSDIWQYATRPISAGETIETKEWPHPSFRPLNYAAGKVLDFFNMRQKSRLARSPWEGDRLRLDDGLTGNEPALAVPPQLKPMELRPTS